MSENKEENKGETVDLDDRMTKLEIVPVSLNGISTILDVVKTDKIHNYLSTSREKAVDSHKKSIADKLNIVDFNLIPTENRIAVMSQPWMITPPVGFQSYLLMLWRFHK